MNALIATPGLQLVFASKQLYMGLGWLGIVEGFTGTDSLFSRIGGLIWILASLALLFISIDKMGSRDDGPD